MASVREKVIVGVLCAAFVTSCSGGGAGRAKSASPRTATSAESDGADESNAEPSTTLLPGAQPGLFDFNQDGTQEPTCGTADFEEGLVVRTYCDDLSGYANQPAEGAALVPGSLLGLPTPADDPRDKPITEGASVAVVHLQSAQGTEIVVLTLSSDTVFAVGSDELQDPALDSLGNIAAGISSSYPGATVEVRGHTDSTGTASDNQSLSERRAAAVADHFASRGLDRSTLSSIGLGQRVPNYSETNPDGSENPVGRDQNRRIEIVIRPG
jgi:outer membrane protein OmpA-like peptidoglycan-associated protein